MSQLVDRAHRRPRDARLTRVAPGVHQLTHGGTNCYLIEEGGRLTLVDTALPATWGPLQVALATLGRTIADIAAVVLTHAHFDHMGVARQLQEAYAVPIHAHPLEHPLAAHPYRYAHERSRLRYPLHHPGGVPILAEMACAGALAVRGVDTVQAVTPGTPLDVPGSPIPLFVPGHTDGHCALHLPDRDAVITGDALVTLDPYTGRRGPRIVAGAATADSATNLRSLDAIAATGASIVLPGHGDRWRGGAEQAVALARAAGPV